MKDAWGREVVDNGLRAEKIKAAEAKRTPAKVVVEEVVKAEAPKPNPIVEEEKPKPAARRGKNAVSK